MQGSSKNMQTVLYNNNKYYPRLRPPDNLSPKVTQLAVQMDQEVTKRNFETQFDPPEITILRLLIAANLGWAQYCLVTVVGVTRDTHDHPTHLDKTKK